MKLHNLEFRIPMMENQKQIDITPNAMAYIKSEREKKDIPLAVEIAETTYRTWSGRACTSIIIQLENPESYHFKRHASEYASVDVDGVEVYVMKKLLKTLPESFRVDVYGWGPFKRLAIRR